MLHNVSRLACINNKETTLLSIKYHIDLFTKHSTDKELSKETEKENHGQILLFKNWIALFNEMLLEIE